LDVVEAWARDWQLQLSVEKCNVGPGLDNYRYHIGHKAQCKNLGIVVANDLSPQWHINEIKTNLPRHIGELTVS